MNKVIQVVTLCADPELKTYGPEAKPVLNFSGAVNKRFKKENETDDFFMYSAFGKTAEFISKYFQKGSKMLIEGEIHNNNYEKDGVKHYSVNINVTNVEFFGKKVDNANGSAPQNQSAPPQNNSNSSDTKYVDYDEYSDF